MMTSIDMQTTTVAGSGARQIARFFAGLGQGLGQAFKAGTTAAPAVQELAEPFRLYAPDQVSSFHLLVVEEGEPVLWSALGEIRQDTRVDRCGDFDEIVQRTRRMPSNQWMVVIDIDGFETTVDAVDHLRHFRAENPDVPVVIGSSYFARHDFSCDRRAIADASVRLPCGRATLALAIGSAIENNRLER